MESLASPLVFTKLRPPAMRMRSIQRAQLIERLAGWRETGLILVCAPAGYGKTTLLAQWSQSLLRDGIAVAWYAIDAGDDDPIPFFSYLVASLIQAIGPLPELAQVAQLLRSSPEIDLQRSLALIINAIAAGRRECVLILDDYHLIGAPAIHSAMAYLLEHLPENLRVVTGSRSDPPLPLARLRARGRLLEIRITGLRFTSQETAQFLNDVMQLELSPEGIAALAERTEGWVAGLQLAALSLSGRPDKESIISSFSGGHRYLVEYLLDEVVTRQPAEVQSFLLATSILERLTAPLCDAILKSSDDSLLSSLNSLSSSSILESLERANLFLIPLDDEGLWYRYHHLFRDFLETRFNQLQPQRVAALHRAACEWLSAHDLLREAAAHAFQTGDWEYAAAFVEQNSFTMIVHSDIATVYKWCSAFPEEVMQMHPLLCLHQCWALALSFRRQNRDRVETRLRQAECMIAAVEDRRQVREMKEIATIIRTFLDMSPDPTADPRKQLSIAQDLLGGYPEGDTGQFSALLMTGYAYLALHEARAAQKALENARQLALHGRLYFGVVESTFHLARLVHSKGQLNQAAEICRQGQADIASMLAHPEQELPALGCLDVALGGVLLEGDRLAEAEEHLLHGLDLMGWGMNPYYLMAAYVSLFRLREIQGRSAEALACLVRLEAAWPDIAFCTRGLRITHTLRAAPRHPDTLADAANWIREFLALVGEDFRPPGMGPFGAAEAYYLASLACSRVQIAAGDAHTALITLARQLDVALANGLDGRVIELSLLEAQAWQAEGDRDRSLTALERALAVAEPAGYLRSFDQSETLNRLLRDAASQEFHREYIERVLAVIGRPEQETTRPEAAIALEFGQQLSQRELEVLRLMAAGASNQTIAETLVITVGTVKSHINHILAKLEAHNRTEAVARARGLGLLEI